MTLFEFSIATGILAAAFALASRFLIKSTPPVDVKKLVPGATPTNVFTIAAGVIAIGALSLKPTSSAHQCVLLNENELKTYHKQLASSVVERQPVTDDLTTQIFVKAEKDGSYKTIYVKRLSDGAYSAHAVALDPKLVYVGATDPSTAVPFFIRDPVTNGIKVNPDAEIALGDEQALLATANSGSVSPTGQAAALYHAASQGHDVSSTRLSSN